MKKNNSCTTEGGVLKLNVEKKPLDLWYIVINNLHTFFISVYHRNVRGTFDSQKKVLIPPKIYMYNVKSKSDDSLVKTEEDPRVGTRSGLDRL